MSFRDRISQWDIIGNAKIFFSISIIVIVVGLIAMGVNFAKTGSPLNFGIDFKGGTVLSFNCETTPSAAKVSEIITSLGYKDPMIQEAQGNKLIIRLSASMIKSEDLTTIQAEVDKLYKINKDTLQVTSISPVIGGEVAKNGAIALGLALLFILFYISIRFEFKIALATVVALFHDILVTLGILSLFRVELNAPFIGAFLAIITYSVEDTVVVMDKIREKLKFRGKEPFRDLVNNSVTDVWVRSMNASITTFFSALALLLFAGPTIRDFSMTLLFGLISGTYSSIYIASPLLVLFRGETFVTNVPKKVVPANVKVAEIGETVAAPELVADGTTEEEAPVVSPTKKSSKKTNKKKKSSKKKK